MSKNKKIELKISKTYLFSISISSNKKKNCPNPFKRNPPAKKIFKKLFFLYFNFVKTRKKWFQKFQNLFRLALAGRVHALWVGEHTLSACILNIWVRLLVTARGWDRSPRGWGLSRRTFFFRPGPEKKGKNMFAFWTFQDILGILYSFLKNKSNFILSPRPEKMG